MELMYAEIQLVAKRRQREGVAEMARLHEMIGQQLCEDTDDAEVVVGIEKTAARGWPRWSPQGTRSTG